MYGTCTATKNLPATTGAVAALQIRAEDLDYAPYVPNRSISDRTLSRHHSLSEEIKPVVRDETEEQTEKLKAIVREFRNLFKSWREQQAALSTKPRFPNLTRLLANHYKEELPASLRSVGTTKLEEPATPGKVRSRRLGRGFQKRAPVDKGIPGETYMDKKLRKGIEAVKDVNYFKAVCCYAKVS